MKEDQLIEGTLQVRQLLCRDVPIGQRRADGLQRSRLSGVVVAGGRHLVQPFGKSRCQKLRPATEGSQTPSLGPGSELEGPGVDAASRSGKLIEIGAVSSLT